MDKLQELERQLQEQQSKLNDLQAEIEKLKQAEEYGNQWVPGFDEDYYFISNSGNTLVDVWLDTEIDKNRLSIGNVFRTEEEAEFEVEKRKVITELKKYAREFVVDEYNYDFCFEYDEQKIIYDWNKTYKNSTLYFPSEEIARQAVAEVGEERVKKYYLGVEVAE